MKHPEGTADHKAEKKRLELVSDMLMVGNDIQMLTGINTSLTSASSWCRPVSYARLGISLIITCFAVRQTIDLYHLHLVYDVVSFVGVSNCAALVCWFFMKAKIDPAIAAKKKHRILFLHFSRTSRRHAVTYIFAVLFLALTIVLETRLSDWSLTSTELGKCYVTSGITSWTANHPGADKTYVAITAIWLLVVMFMTVLGAPGIRRPLLVIGALQFPVHFYMMISLKVANQGHLEGAEGETGWDFGQTTALLLLGVTLSELLGKWLNYRRFERSLLKGPPTQASLDKAEKNGKPPSDGVPSGELSESATHGQMTHNQTSRGKNGSTNRQDEIEMTARVDDV